MKCKILKYFLVMFFFIAIFLLPRVYCYAEEYNGYVYNLSDIDAVRSQYQEEEMMRLVEQRRAQEIEATIRIAEEQAAKRQKEEERQKILTYIVVGGLFLLLIFNIPRIYKFWRHFTDPKNIGQRRYKKELARIAREERERTAKVERERELRRRELELQRAKEAEINQYRQLRKDIEAMPEYERWRQAVLDKFDGKCAINDGNCAGNIEVDHRYKSFHRIVREYGITNTIQAYECAALWDVNNGAPLCKFHHDQTKSSMYNKQI